MARKRKAKPQPKALDDMPALPRLVPEPKTEAELWRAHFAVLARAVLDRRPDVAARVRAELDRLDGQMSGVVNRREMAARAGTTVLVETLTEEIVMLASRVKFTARLLRQADRPKGLPRDDGPTPEAALKPASRDIIALLEGKRDKDGKLVGITPQQAEAARRIAQINEAIAAAGQVRGTNLEGAGGGHGGQFRDIVIAGKLDEMRSRKYLPWCERLNATESTRVTLDIVIKVAVYNGSLRALEKRHHLRNGTGIARLREGLDAFINQPWVFAPPHSVAVADIEA